MWFRSNRNIPESLYVPDVGFQVPKHTRRLWGMVAHSACTCMNEPPRAYVCDAVVYTQRVRGFIIDRTIGVYRYSYCYTPTAYPPIFVSVIRTRQADMCTAWRLHTYHHGVYYVYAVRMFIYATHICHVYWSRNVCINFVVAMLPLYDKSWSVNFVQVVEHSATGTRTRVARVRAEYPNQLDYSGFRTAKNR